PRRGRAADRPAAWLDPAVRQPVRPADGLRPGPPGQRVDQLQRRRPRRQHRPGRRRLRARRTAGAAGTDLSDYLPPPRVPLLSPSSWYEPPPPGAAWTLKLNASANDFCFSVMSAIFSPSAFSMRLMMASILSFLAPGDG